MFQKCTWPIVDTLRVLPRCTTLHLYETRLVDFTQAELVQEETILRSFRLLVDFGIISRVSSDNSLLIMTCEILQD